MIYYNLESPYTGDVTKNCGLTINEVDGNFYELEQLCMELRSELDSVKDEIRNLKDEIDELKHKSPVLSWTAHDTNICQPGTSPNATFEMVDGSHYNVFVSGVVSYYGDTLPDGTRKGNRIGVVIAPVYENQGAMYPDAEVFVNNKNIGNLWDIISEVEGCIPAVYLYPKIERIGGETIVSLNNSTNNDNTLEISVKWDENNTETYSYTIDPDIELEVLLSRTVHDGDICPDGTSNDATYTVTPEDKHTMVIGGELDKDAEGHHVFGVAIQPVGGTDRETYPDAEWFVSNGETFDYKGNIWDAMENIPFGWTKALYLKPTVERSGSGNVYVSLGNDTVCSNMLWIRIDWDRDISEQYMYIVDNNIILKEDEGQ